MAGWIKIHRDLMEHWVSDEPESLAVFLRLLCEANFVSKKRQINGSPVMVPRGSLVFGYNAFSERSGVSTAKLRRIMKKLKEDGIIDRQNFSKFSIVSITKYEDYQSDDKQPAGSQQAESKQPATLEEGKNSTREENPSSSSDDERKPSSSGMTCPHQGILDQWEEVMSDKRQPIRTMWTPSRKDYKNLAARWKQMADAKHETTGEPLYTTREEGVEWWGRFFAFVRKSKFLMADENNWFDLGWVVKADNFQKIIERKYHGES